VGVPDFVDEWVSAPYEAQQKDGKVIRAGLAWIDGEAKKRFSKGFADCAPADQTALLDDIVDRKTEAHKKAFDFFKNFRDKVTGGYYSTPEGWKAIGLRRQYADGRISRTAAGSAQAPGAGVEGLR
jgi:hypothetical protein